MWQQRYQQYRAQGLEVVGIALDVEGASAARPYYEKAGVTFRAWVDPDYATDWTFVPHTIFVDAQGVVRPTDGWQQVVAAGTLPAAVSPQRRELWSDVADQQTVAQLERLEQHWQARPDDLHRAAALAKACLSADREARARTVLERAVRDIDPRAVARQAGPDAAALADVYRLMVRCALNQDDRLRYAALAFYAEPSVGWGKQVARLIDAARFDDRADGSLDDDFREATLQRLRRERQQWLQQQGHAQQDVAPVRPLSPASHSDQ